MTRVHRQFEKWMDREIRLSDWSAQTTARYLRLNKVVLNVLGQMDELLMVDLK